MLAKPHCRTEIVALPHTIPEFILQLRQQPELAKGKEKARDAKSSQPEDVVSDIGSRPNTGVSYLRDTSESTHFQQSTRPHPPSPTQTSDAIEDDLFGSLMALMTAKSVIYTM